MYHIIFSSTSILVLSVRSVGQELLPFFIDMVLSKLTILKVLFDNSTSTLAWKIPWTEEPGRLQSMGSQRVRHDYATSLSLFTFTHWRRKWQPIPVFLPGESQGQGAWWAAVYGSHRVGHD